MSVGCVVAVQEDKRAGIVLPEISTPTTGIVSVPVPCPLLPYKVSEVWFWFWFSSDPSTKVSQNSEPGGWATSFIKASFTTWKTPTFFPLSKGWDDEAIYHRENHAVFYSISCCRRVPLGVGGSHHVSQWGRRGDTLITVQTQPLSFPDRETQCVIFDIVDHLFNYPRHLFIDPAVEPNRRQRRRDKPKEKGIVGHRRRREIQKQLRLIGKGWVLLAIIGLPLRRCLPRTIPPHSWVWAVRGPFPQDNTPSIIEYTGMIKRIEDDLCVRVLN